MLRALDSRAEAPMSTHLDHHYSITVVTEDSAVLYCLRALAVHAQRTGNTRIYCRRAPLTVAKLLGLVAQHDNDPATPQANR